MIQLNDRKPHVELRQNSTCGLPDWQLVIVRRYPSVYLEPSSEVLALYSECPEHLDRDNHCNLRFGFECGPGWSQLLDELSARAVSLAEALRSCGLQPDARITANVCQEKSGMLCWQGDDNLIEPFRDLWYVYVRSIEHRSGFTCERTGKPGRLHTIGGWPITLCDAEAWKELRLRSSIKR